MAHIQCSSSSNPSPATGLPYYPCENQIKFGAVRKLKISNCQSYSMLSHLNFTGIQEYSENRPQSHSTSWFSLPPPVYGLESLRLSHHTSLKLKRDSFRNHKSLSIIVVKNSRGVSIDEDSFADLINLRHLGTV